MPLVVVSSGLVSLASWFAFQGVAEAIREATLREIGVEALRRSESDSQLFTLAENNLLQARSVLAKRLREPATPLTSTPRPDGTWPLIPTTGDKPLAAFVSRVSDGAVDQREVATAIGLLNELGSSWCRGLPAIAIAAPRRWHSAGTSATGKAARWWPAVDCRARLRGLRLGRTGRRTHGRGLPDRDASHDDRQATVKSSAIRRARRRARWQGHRSHAVSQVTLLTTMSSMEAPSNS